MRVALPPEIERLIRETDLAVALGDVAETTERIKNSLIDFSRLGGSLPGSFRDGANGHYARRLLHRNASLGYTIVVMIWGPGQRTDLHDHAGMWCVECVLDGKLAVTQFDLVEQDGPRCRFEERKSVEAGVGTAGCLIPPFEYHVLGNALDDRNTVTMHVYGGEMNSCNLYRPDPSGWWHRTPKVLSYDS